MKSFPDFKQEQREAFHQMNKLAGLACLDDHLHFLDSLIDSTVQYVLENCMPEEKLLSLEQMTSKDGKEINDNAYGFNECREAFLAKARELGFIK